MQQKQATIYSTVGRPHRHGDICKQVDGGCCACCVLRVIAGHFVDLSTFVVAYSTHCVGPGNRNQSRKYSASPRRTRGYGTNVACVGETTAKDYCDIGACWFDGAPSRGMSHTF